jgi:hypothetical protein
MDATNVYVERLSYQSGYQTVVGSFIAGYPPSTYESVTFALDSEDNLVVVRQAAVRVLDDWGAACTLHGSSGSYA